MKKKLFLLTGLVLAIAAGLLVMQPKEAYANGPCNPPCQTPCECPTVTIDNQVYNPLTQNCGQLTFIYPSPCADEVVDVEYGGLYSTCSQGDCGAKCALGLNFQGCFIDFSGGANTWTISGDHCCGAGTQIKITFTPDLTNCCNHGTLTLECI
ncbi:MAG: hypothetical protein KDC92_00560 [Bacteroidetes bacterium]|nr:hypothetical protein [Bacteroidota bacterium]